jgi:hypothetical protein
MSILIALFVVLPASCQVGYWLGRRSRVRRDDIEKTRAGGWQAALLALAGLLVGFTFSMAQGRYEDRKQIVIKEANAIGTTYLRSQLLDAAPGEELRALLRHYVDVRLAFGGSGANVELTERLMRESSGLGDLIWARVVAAGRADRSAAMATLINTTNEMLDASEERGAAIANPLPLTVFVVLFLATAVAMASTGFVCALEDRRSVLGMIVMPLLLATVVGLIFDLAHPRIGIVKVRDPILTRLKQSF